MAKRMTDSIVHKAEKPVSGWRQRIVDARAVADPAWRRYRAAIFQGYLIAAVVVFGILAVLAHTIAYFTFDLTITEEIQESHGFVFDALMRAVTWIGFSPQAPILIGLGILFHYVSGLKWEAVMTLLGNIGISILGAVVKLIVLRPRPSPDLVNVIAELPDYGFPSGHVLFFVTFFGFLAFLAVALFKPSWGRRLILLILFSLIALVGISRIYLGEHWASDVIAAYLLGSVWLAACVRVYRWGKPRFFVNQPVAKETQAAES